MDIDELKFKEMYNNINISIRQIQKEFGIKYSADLYKIRDRLNLPNINRNKKGNILTKELLVELYINQNKSTNDIGLLYSLNAQTVSDQLKKHNIDRRNRGAVIKHQVNHNYFNNIDEKAARILGLIASDGNILYTQQAGSYRINFISQDVELNNFIKENLGGVIYYNKKRNIYDNIIISKYIYDFLIKIGLVENKHNIFEIDFSILNTEDLLYSFLIGYIDGDGHISCKSNPKQYNSINTEISISTNSEKFKNQIIKSFKEFSNVYCKAYISDFTGITTYNYRVSCTTKENQLYFINKIIKISKKSGILNRKYQEMLKIKQYIERNQNVL